ncbi:MAG TPA: hypothetical protein VK155_08660 [Bacteroidales bacterium]|jgi:hypothetical protein|nr:hypothetical protein [Bacteroidales bacterium]
MRKRKTKSNWKLGLAGILITGAIAIGSCTKDELTPENQPGHSGVAGGKFAIAPADKVAIPPDTTTLLTWPAASGKYNIYFGEAQVPALFKNSYSVNTLNVPVSEGRTYYWRIGTIDSYGVETLSPLFSFRVKARMNLEKFTGSFECTEPDYARYQVNFSKLSGDTLLNDNFWDLKWALKYIMNDMGQVNIVPKTFSPDPSMKVSVSGTGTFDNEKNEMKVSYVVLQDAAPGTPLAVEIDRNTHTFVKK